MLSDHIAKVFTKGVSVALGFSFLTLCPLALCETNTNYATPNVPTLELAHTYRSNWSKIRYRYPKNWVVREEGLSDWLAPSIDKMFWNPGFDQEEDAYYTINNFFFPHASPEEIRSRENITLDSVVKSSIHSLRTIAHAELIGAPESILLGGKKAVELLLAIGETQVHCQIFIQLAPGQIATVSGNGPRKNIRVIQATARAVAGVVELDI